MTLYHVELVYDDLYGDYVESFDWTLEQLADTIQIDSMQWNPEFRAFDQNQPLLIDEYVDVKGNWIHVETFVSHQDGSRLTGDELEQIALAARGELPITMRQQRLPLTAARNVSQDPIVSAQQALELTKDIGAEALIRYWPYEIGRAVRQAQDQLEYLIGILHEHLD